MDNRQEAEEPKIDFTVNHVCGKTICLSWHWKDYMKLAYLLNNPKENHELNSYPDFCIKFEYQRNLSLKFKSSRKYDMQNVMETIKNEVSCNRAVDLDQFKSHIYKDLPDYISQMELYTHKQVYMEEHDGLIYAAVDRNHSKEFFRAAGMFNAKSSRYMQASGGSGSGSEKSNSNIKRDGDSTIDSSRVWPYKGTTVHVVQASEAGTGAKYVTDMFETWSPIAGTVNSGVDEQQTKGVGKIPGNQKQPGSYISEQANEIRKNSQGVMTIPKTQATTGKQFQLPRSREQQNVNSEQSKSSDTRKQEKLYPSLSQYNDEGQPSSYSGQTKQDIQGRHGFIQGSRVWPYKGTTVHVVQASEAGTGAKYVTDMFETWSPIAGTVNSGVDEQQTKGVGKIPGNQKQPGSYISEQANELRMNSQGVMTIPKTQATTGKQFQLPRSREQQNVNSEQSKSSDTRKQEKLYPSLSQYNDEGQPSSYSGQTKQDIQGRHGFIQVSKNRKSKIEIELVRGALEQTEAGIIACTLSGTMDLTKGQASRALLKAAGESIQQELDTRYGDYLEEGEIAVTKAGRLRCRNLLFGVLYSYDKASDKHNDGEDYYVKSSVYDFMRTCLETAEEKKVATIAFPAIGSGGLGYPVYTVAEAMFDAVTTYNSSEPVSYLKQVIFVVHHEDDYAWGVFKLRMEHFGKDGSTSDKSSADGSEDEQNQPSGLSSSRKGMTSKSSEKVKQNSVRSKPASPQDHDDGTRSPRVDEQHFTDSYRGQRPGEIDDLSIRMGSQSLNDTDRSDNKQIGDKHTDRARDLSSSSNKMVKDGTVPASKKRISWPQSHPKSVVEWFISDILKKYRKKNFEFNIVDDCMLYDGPDELDSVFRTEFKSARQKLSSDIQSDHLDVSESTVAIHIDRERETDSGVFIVHVQADKIINFYGKQWNDIQKVKSMFQAELFPNTVTTRRDRQLCTKESPENDFDTPSANDQSKINLCSATSGTENGARQKTSKGMRGKSTVPDFQRQFSWTVNADNLEVFKVKNVTVKVYSADILNVPVDCILNAANSQLNHQGGVAKVIAKAAGRKLIQEGEAYIKRHGPLQCGEACETSAGKLQYHHVIHTVGPCWSWYKPHSQTDVERCEFDLRMAIKNSLSRAEQLRHSSIAIPAVSSGNFGCPVDFCAVQYARAILDYVDFSRSPLQEIHFVDTNLSMVMVIQKVFRSMIRKGKPPNDYDVKKYVCTSVASTQTRKEKKECVICMEDSKPPDCVLCDCGHLVTCMTCASKLQQCPVCREEIKQRVKVFT